MGTVVVSEENTMWLPHYYLLTISESSTSFTKTIVAVLVTFFVTHLVVVYHRRQRLPPGPWPWPIVGNLDLLTGLAHRKLQKVAARYGGLMYLQLGEKPCLVVSTAGAAKELFKSHDATFSSRPRKLVLDVLTAGTYRNLPVAPYGHYWRQLRRLANTQLFSPATHASHEGIRNGELHNMMKLLLVECLEATTSNSTTTTQPIDLRHWLTGVTSNNMTMMLTNNRFFDIRNKDDEKRRYDDVLRRSIDANGAMIISDYVPSLSFITKLQGWEPYLLEIQKRGRAIVHKVIDVESHRQRVTDVPDFVDVLLKAPLDDAGKPLSDGEIMSLLLSFLNAGTDTSATTAEWAMAELMAHPSIRHEAQAELMAVVGENQLVEEADLANLPLLQAIVKETLRLHPAAPLSITRECHEPCVVSGYQFPAKTQLILNIFAIHRDPSVYPNPDEFKPTRFLHGPEVNINHLSSSGHDVDFQLIPFGVGRRMCPGARLAFTLVSLMLAHLLHSFDWSLPHHQTPESMDMRETPSFVLYRGQRLLLHATPRTPASLY